jgi:general secretion pathway protein G
MNHRFLRFMFSLTVFCIFVSLTMCPTSARAADQENTKFSMVEKKLDQGGNCYIYMNVEGATEKFYKKLAKTFSGPGADPSVIKGFEITESIIRQLGIFSIRDIGYSSIQEDDSNIVRTFIHIPRETRGIVNAMCREPKDLSSLKYAPVETAVFAAQDCDFLELYRNSCKALKDSCGPDFEAQFDKHLTTINTSITELAGKKTSLEDLLDSSSGETAFLLNWDENNKINIPSQPNSVQIPGLRVALLIQLENPLLFEIIQAKLKKVGFPIQPQTYGSLTKMFFPIPPNPFYTLSPVLAWDGSYIILSSHNAFLEEILEAKKSGKNLTTNKEFQNFMKGLPEKQNSLIFASYEGLKTSINVVDKIMDITEAMGQPNPMARQIKMISEKLRMGWAHIRTNDKDGICLVTKCQGDCLSGDTTVSSHKESRERFKQMSQKLDRNGDIYIYMDVRDSIKAAFDYWKSTLNMQNTPDEIIKAFAGLEKILQLSGCYNIRDIGLSRIRSGDLLRTKKFISLTGEKQGIFKALGAEPHKSQSLDYAPANSDIFISEDINLKEILSFALEANAILLGLPDVPDLKKIIVNIKEEMGIDVQKLAEDCGEEFAFILQRDPSRKMTISGVMNQEIKFSLPRMAFLVPVKNDVIFKSISSEISMQDSSIKEISEGKVRKILLQKSSPNANYPTEPAIAFDGTHVIITTHISLLDAILEAKKSGNCLKNSKTFQKYTRDLPAEFNGLCYFNHAIFSELQEVLAGLNDNQGNLKWLDIKALADLLIPLHGDLAAVRINQSDGIRWVMHRDAKDSPGLIQAAVAPAYLFSSISIFPVITLGAIAVPNFLEAQIRSKVSRVRADIRYLRTAIETYKIDNRIYPSWCLGKDSFNADEKIPGFRMSKSSQGAENFMSLTTPVSYITEFPKDPFSPDAGTYAYYSINDSWVIFSPGPDKKYDITPEKDFIPGDKNTDSRIISKTYDPTNGTISAGDIIRVKQ